jgi:hydroxymethylpyrimidine kinase/phosphomethylpyrimidine kinase
VVALTAVTAQHLASVDRVEPVALDLVEAQIEGIGDDLAPAAVKTGLLGSVEGVEAVARRVESGSLPPPVVDPVLVDGRGSRLAAVDIEAAYRRALVPVARVVTPNLAEASVLVGRSLATVGDVVAAAPELVELGAEYVIVTGGALGGDEAVDVVVAADATVDILAGSRVATGNVRGSGCTLAAAVAAGLALGEEPLDAARSAKRFVADRLADSAGWEIGPGGPVLHRLATPPGQGTSDHSSP